MVGGLLSVPGLIAATYGDDGPAQPDFGGVWARDLGWELPDSGPGPAENCSRANGTSDAQMLVGDYASPILKPHAAVKRLQGEMSKAAQAFPTLQPMRLYGYALHLRVNEMEMVQQRDRVLILYMQDHQVRTIRLNASHPVKVMPTWHGDSIGHYEGDTLVVDTVGIKVGPASNRSHGALPTPPIASEGREHRQHPARPRRGGAGLRRRQDQGVRGAPGLRHPPAGGGRPAATCAPSIEIGASPRASLNLVAAARAHAFLRHRGFVTPEDVKAIGLDVLRHRVILTYEAEAEEVTPDRVVQRIFERVEVP